MRDILDQLVTIVESTGLAGRKLGDVFKSPQGEEIVFQEIRFFPEESGKYTPEEMDSALASVPKSVQWLNKRTSKSGGFAIIKFKGDNGEILFGRYLESVKPNITDNYISNSIGPFNFAGKAAAKAQSGLSPQDLLTDRVDLTIPDIMNQLAQKMGTDNPLYAVAHKVAMGEKLPITIPAPKGVSFTGFRDYFCEILQPMALQKGNFTGNAGEAAQRFLGGSFNDTVISFDNSKTAGLSDSILSKSDGRYIKVSSKGGGGAKASAKNLVDAVDELSGTPEGQKLIKKHKDVVDLLREIQKAGQAGAPLMVGVRFGVLNQKDADQILELRNTKPVNLNKIDNITNLSPTLKKLAKERKTDNPEMVNLYYHLMAAVAHKAAQQVNEKTNFSKAATEILNNGALVQVYTKAIEGKDTWTLKEFNTVYPSDEIKGVYLDASKNYMSTNIKGNFTFLIDKGTGKPKAKNADAVDTGPDPDLADVAGDIVEPRRKRKPETPQGAGREKRAK